MSSTPPAAPATDLDELARKIAFGVVLAAFAEYGITREAVAKAIAVVERTPCLGEPAPDTEQETARERQ